MAPSQASLSELAAGYPASAIRTVFDRVAEVEQASSAPVLKLTVGEPDFDTPEHIVAAGIKSLRDCETRYGPNAGLPEFRDAVARHYTKRWARPLSRSGVMATVGGNEALLLAMSVLLDPGDDVLVCDPCYPNYLGHAHILRARPVPVPLDPCDGFRVTADRVEEFITPRTRVLVINSPSNPVGTVISAAELRKIAELADRHGFHIVSDEVYDRIVFDGADLVSIAQIGGGFDRFLVVNSLSKSYAMTGWRAGFVIGPDRLIAPMARIQEGIVSCLPVFVQRAGVAALDGPDEYTDQMLAAYQSRRDLLSARLRSIPELGHVEPEGAFYQFVDIRGTGLRSRTFADRLLDEQRVAVVPGSAFGTRGEGFVRLSFATDEATIEAAVRRIADFVRNQA